MINDPKTELLLGKYYGIDVDIIDLVEDADKYATAYELMQRSRDTGISGLVNGIHSELSTYGKDPVEVINEVFSEYGLSRIKQAGAA